MTPADHLARLVLPDVHASTYLRHWLVVYVAPVVRARCDGGPVCEATHNSRIVRWLETARGPGVVR